LEKDIVWNIPIFIPILSINFIPIYVNIIPIYYFNIILFQYYQIILLSFNLIILLCINYIRRMLYKKNVREKKQRRRLAVARGRGAEGRGAL